MWELRKVPTQLYSNVYLASKGSKLSKQTDGFTALLIQLTTRVVQPVPLCMGQVGISNFVCVRMCQTSARLHGNVK